MPFWKSWLFVLVALSAVVNAATAIFEWEMSYVTAAPDGVERSVIGVNGHFPPPTIIVSKGDRVVIHVTNNFNDGEFLTLHTHGIFQNGTNYYDGVDQVTQCGVPPGESFVYDFTVGEQTGTYWIHSHVKGQYPNGLRAPFIVKDPSSPYHGLKSTVLSVSDWYNQTMQVLIPEFLSVNNPDGVEPVPDAALMWDTQNATDGVVPGETVHFHIANIGAFGYFHIWIEEHTFTVIEVDGVDVEPYETPGIDVAVGQRLGVLVKMNADPTKNYPIVGAMDQSMFDHDSLAPNVTSWLVYNSAAPKPQPQLIQAFCPWNDTDLVPVTPLPPVEYDTLFNITVNFTDINGINYAIINNNSYKPPDVPAMFTALTTGSNATNPAVYAPSVTNTFVLNHLDMIWLAVNNEDDGGHPFHLHGHSFQVLYRSEQDAGYFQLDNIPPFPPNPMRRDVLLIPGGGYAIIAFRADNPGAWFFHCHIDWHVVAGMVAQFVEAPLEMQKRLVVPPEVVQQCTESNIRVCGPAFSD